MVKGWGIPLPIFIGGTMEDICKQKDCSCENVGIGDCTKLQELNDLQIRPKMRAILKAEWCNLPEAIRRGFYGVWCVLKNIINQLCYILTKLECLESKVDKLCSIAKCQDQRITGLVEHIKGKMLENVVFGMKGVGTSANASGNGDTFTSVAVQQNGNFTIVWNMVYAGREVGRGTITGKVSHMYTMNEDGSVKAYVSRVDFDSVKYVGDGGSYGNNATFSIQDTSGRTVWTKSYQTGSSFTDKPGSISIGKETVLRPQGGSTGDILLFKTLDQWDFDPTSSDVRATYVNNNSPLPKVEGCVIDCDNC